ncbi:MAG: UDP-N-acetylmuramoyl-L-alanyl-D-glutamate--2,6-diaminopimelate ligase [Anaerolineales bacterium]
MNLFDLTQHIQILNPLPLDRIDIQGITLDSRQVEPGFLYVAVPGKHADGHDYISDALNAGAAAVLGSKESGDYQELAVPYLQVEHSREALAQLAAAWYGFPARDLVVIGVTGTDGKTTTVNLIYQILISAGFRAGLRSTVNAVIGGRTLDTGFHVTTPEAMDVQYYLAEMVKAGISHVVLEATSHGLAQQRVRACEFDIGVVTNITHEHLDYHGDYQAYLQAKAELFRLVRKSEEKEQPVNKLAVLNKDDRSYPMLNRIVGDLELPRVEYSTKEPADFQAVDFGMDPTGIDFKLRHQEKVIPIHSDLLGDYNVSNCLAAAAACVSGLDVDWEAVQGGIAGLKAIPGRMERVDLGQDFVSLVDFAHTPNALKQALQAGRSLGVGRIIAVFGSAGLRDQEKRRLMAEESARLADVTILTAEDPRTESLDDILEEMMQGAAEQGAVEGRNLFRVRDRGQAVRRALQMAEAGDVVLVCGKGHEQSMCFGEVEYPWDDRLAVRAALSEMLELSGPEMPYLPTQEDL